MISGFRRGPIFKGLHGLVLKVRPIGCPEMSAKNYQSTLRKIPEERSSRQTLCPKYAFKRVAAFLQKKSVLQIYPRRSFVQVIREMVFCKSLGGQDNHLTPNDHFSGSTAPLTSRCCIFLFIQQIYVLNILNMLHTL